MPLTQAEASSIQALSDSGRSARAAARLVEVQLPSHLSPTSRPLFYKLEHALGEVNEASTRALALLLDGIAANGDDEKALLKDAPRSVFIDRARDAVGEAQEEALEGLELLKQASSLSPPDDLAWHDALGKASFQCSQALRGLARVDLGLSYASPAPDGADPSLSRDIITSGYRSAGQYGYLSAEVLFEATLNSSDQLLPEAGASLLASALSTQWLAEDDVCIAMLAAAGIGESLQATLARLLIKAAGRFRAYLTAVGALTIYAPSRPALTEAIIQVLEDGPDAWMRADNMASRLLLRLPS